MELKIPTQREPTEDSFPGTPRKVKKWLAELQTSDIGETTRQLYNGLKHSNRLVNDARARVEVMEMFRPVTRLVCNNLLKKYNMLGLPLPEKARRIFDLNLAFLTEMAFGYKIAISDSSIDNSPLSPKIHGLAAHRAISYLSELLLRCLQNYAPVTTGAWQDMHQVYASCEAINYHTKPIPDAELVESSRSSVEDTYKRALLLSLCRPESLRKGEVVYVYKALETWVSLAKLNSLGGRQDISQLFGINLDTDAPPTALRFLHASKGSNIRTLDLSELLRTVTKKLDAIPEVDSPIVHDKELPRNALVCLKANWGMQAERKSARAMRGEKVTVEVGLKDIHAHLVYLQTPPKEANASSKSVYGGSDYTDLQLMSIPPEDRKETASSGGFITHPDMKGSEEHNVWDTVVTRSGLTETAMEAKKQRLNTVGAELLKEGPAARQEWSVINKSSGGFGLKWIGESTTRAHVGELIALREAPAEKQPTQWRIGMLRWMQFSNDNTFVCGVQTISPRIVPVIVERKRSSSLVDVTLQECLMLPEIKPIGQASSLISPAHMFRLGEIVTIKVGGRELKYKLIDLEEQTGSFSQFLIQSTSVGTSKNVAPAAVTPKKPTPSTQQEDDEFGNLWDKL